MWCGVHLCWCVLLRVRKPVLLFVPLGLALYNCTWGATLVCLPAQHGTAPSFNSLEKACCVVVKIVHDRLLLPAGCFPLGVTE